ncbi:hypothetical protein FB451DRAFT_1187420 [Mycena latifolia]|nr:hypothetical protein FB451DRAFT_1187420 [Mycena latifolia]
MSPHGGVRLAIEAPDSGIIFISKSTRISRSPPFTRLDLQIPIDLPGEGYSDAMRDLARLRDLLNHRRLSIATEHEPIAAFAFPNLLDLVIETNESSPWALLDICDRSKFRLTHLGPLTADLGADNLIPILRQVLTLQTLELYHCCVDNDSENLCGAFIVESVCMRRRGPNLALPAPMEVDLSLRGPRFVNRIEARFAAACAIGLVKDNCECQNFLELEPGGPPRPIFRMVPTFGFHRGQIIVNYVYFSLVSGHRAS